MRTSFSFFHGVVRRLGQFYPARPPAPAAPIVALDAARPAPPRQSRQAGGGGVAFQRQCLQLQRFQSKWQLHMKMAQTPSNLM